MIGGFLGSVARRKMPRTTDAAPFSDDADAGLTDGPMSAPSIVGAPADASEPLSSLDHDLSANEIAGAIAAGAVRRLIVLSAGAGRQPLGGIALARRVAAFGSTTVLLDFTPGDEVCTRTATGGSTNGFADLLTGEADLSDIIQRDHFSRVHVVPSGGFDPDRSVDWPAVRLFLDAFAEVYDCTVIEYEPSATDNLAAILDDDTALVLSTIGGGDGQSSAAADRLRRLGIGDLIRMDARAI